MKERKGISEANVQKYELEGNIFRESVLLIHVHEIILIIYEIHDTFR